MSPGIPEAVVRFGLETAALPGLPHRTFADLAAGQDWLGAHAAGVEVVVIDAPPDFIHTSCFPPLATSCFLLGLPSDAPDDATRLPDRPSLSPELSPSSVSLFL